MNLSKFLPKKNRHDDTPEQPGSGLSETDLPPESAPGSAAPDGQSGMNGLLPVDPYGAVPPEKITISPDEAKQEEAALDQVVEKQKKGPILSIGPVTEKITRVNKLILAAAGIAAFAFVAWIMWPSGDSQQKEVKAQEVRTNTATQNSALTDLQKAEAEKGGEARQKALANGRPIKEGEVRSSAPSKQQTEAGRSARMETRTSAPQQTAEEKEAAEERKAAKVRAQKAVDLRAAEDRAGERSDIFFDLGSETGGKASKQIADPTVNDYYNESYDAGSDADYIQVIESGNSRRPAGR